MAPLKVVPIATKATSSATWSGEQCVAAFLDEIRTKKIDPSKLMILWFEQEADGRMRPHRWFANVNPVEEVALLELGKALAIEGWRDR